MPNVLGGRTSGFGGSARAQAGRGASSTAGGGTPLNRKKSPGISISANGLGFTIDPGNPVLNSGKPHVVAPTPFSSSGPASKPTESGVNGKRPNNLKKFSSNPISPVVQAVNQDMQFNKMQKPGLDVAQTVLGLMPSGPLPMGLAFGAGRWMNKQVDEDALAHPENYKTIPGMPGGVESISGPKNANRALPGPAAKTTEASTDENIKKKKQPLPTLLGAPGAPLGTPTNPQIIS